ncbi:glycosyltransferase family 1 protein [Paenibacillus psychroresistens]|uniref:Glycosyltransferase family 1 protein n=1 Tax=Paenibacillus psychroresistens TaxID=1778678 RepID=A0A6B8RVB0_9BACL|nr:glycosyltransferase family 4 protein [Paenibacillus psychroresistens]QGQ99565.1 glycosyltransferase family 1 protein [Paenibacillus psychroresistens]
MKRNKVLLVTGVFPPGIGGMQKYYYNIGKHSKHDLTVLAPHYPDDKAFDAKQSFKIIRGPFMKNERVHITSWLRLFKHVRKAIREENTELTIYGYVMIGLIGLIMQKLFGHKYVISTHGMDMLQFRRFWGLNFMTKLILQQADGVLTNSEFTKKLVLGYGVDPSKVELVFPGVEEMYEKQSKHPDLVKKHDLEGKYALLTVGRLVKRKGHDRVIESLPQLIRDIPELVYLIVGDGPERSSLEQLAAKLGLSDRVIFVGNIHDEDLLNQYYNTCDQFLMIARELDTGNAEGFGIVYLEAACAGIPVIAGNSGGAGEAVLHEKTGLVVDPNATTEIANAILRLKNDPILREALIRQGYDRAKGSFRYPILTQKFDRYMLRLCSTVRVRFWAKANAKAEL